MKAAPQCDSGVRRFSPNRNSAQEGGLKEEGEDALHPERLSDHGAGFARKGRPVCAELEFHGNPRDHSESEVDGEDFGPEARRSAVPFVAGPQRHGLQDQDQKRQSHGELRKQIVVGDSESEMEPVHDQG